MACPHLCNVICCPLCVHTSVSVVVASVCPYICIGGCSCVSLAPTHACRIASVRGL
uniref:Uncharacterized protein n=1 Tax=Anguilla anguilla TaxID=7936 RepID=A0A0E9XUY3_ANGAN